MIWLVEKPSDEKPRIRDVLQGQYAIRLIASAKSFSRIIKMTKHQELPQIVIFNSQDFDDDHLKVAAEWLAKHSNPLLIMVNTSQIITQNLTIPISSSELPFTLMQLIDDRSEREADYSIDFEQRSLDIPSQQTTIKLSYREAKILKSLMDAEAKTLNRGQLISVAWQGEQIGVRTIDSHISRLRRKLKSTHLEIESIYGGGYRLREGQSFF